jgi:hypothetical protein
LALWGKVFCWMLGRVQCSHTDPVIAAVEADSARVRGEPSIILHLTRVVEAVMMKSMVGSFQAFT